MTAMILMRLLRLSLTFVKGHPFSSYTLLALILANLTVWGAISFVSADLVYFILYIVLVIFILAFVAFLLFLLRNSHTP